MLALRRCVVPGLALGFLFGCSLSARADLAEYVKRPEPKFAWELKEKKEVPAGHIYDLFMTSQVWQDIPWTHQLRVYQAKEAKPNGTMFIYNTGGGSNTLNDLLGMELSKRTKAPVAVLYHIPKQPLFGGKKEDDLIAETFLRYLKTKDESWPLLFPMVKSVIKSMDALQEFSLKEWKQPTLKFIIAGASKRGWTTWLTATQDPRVAAIAPMVIDVLNMHKQMPNQVESFGGYSEMIHNYVETGLVKMTESPEAQKLWNMVDPYAYRDKLTMPKFIILGNNDPYWATDALNFYWDDLKGDKYVMYIPNAGHDLRQTDKKDPIEGVTRVVNGLSAFSYLKSNNKPLPKLEWKHEANGKDLTVNVKTSVEPKAARLWVAKAPTKDFRKAKWVEAPALISKDGTVSGKVETPKEGCVAYYAELEFDADGIPYQLSTQLKIAGTPRKK